MKKTVDYRESWDLRGTSAIRKLLQCLRHLVNIDSVFLELVKTFPLLRTFFEVLKETDLSGGLGRSWITYSIDRKF